MSEEIIYTEMELPIPLNDLLDIEALLSQEDVFCSASPEDSVYSVMFYESQHGPDEVETRIVLDRNIYLRLLRLAEGRPASSDYRIPAAVMAFAQCAGIMLDPSIAIAEGCHARNDDELRRQIELFRGLDELHPAVLADIALGRAKTLNTALAAQAVTQDLTHVDRRLRHFSIAYPLVMKIGLLELEGGKQIDRMHRFLEWMHAEWYYVWPAVLFAAMCFSSSAPRAALKNLRNADRSRALEGLRNAAWDLTYSIYWRSQLRTPGQELTLFCTTDNALKKVVSGIVGVGDDSDAVIKDAFCKLMGEAIGQAAYGRYHELRMRTEEPNRVLNATDGEERILHHKRTERALEEAVLVWRKRPR